MRAEVIAIGDELTTGQRLDTNTKWLSERLTEIGVDVAFHTTVGDTLDNNVAAFCLAIERADVVVCTGGLGPTADDLTRAAIAAATGVELMRDDASLAHIRNLFASRGREMPERNAVQAEFPAGAKPIPNEHGTAPGIDMMIQRNDRQPCRVFALPGVPAELIPMWCDSVAPEILALQPEPRVTVHHRVKCFGAGESHIEAMLPDMIARQRDPIVGITVSDATITLRITASGPNAAACRLAMQPTVQEIYDTLGDLAFGEEDDELEHAVARLLSERNQTLAVAEWATAGLISERLGVAGAGSVGVTISNWSQAEKLLGCEFAADVSPHDASVAIALAEAVRSKAEVEIGLGVAAFPPNLDGPDAYVCVAMTTAQRTRKLRFPCASHPAIRRPRAAKHALNAVRLKLLRGGV